MLQRAEKYFIPPQGGNQEGEEREGHRAHTEGEHKVLQEGKTNVHFKESKQYIAKTKESAELPEG